MPQEDRCDWPNHSAIREFRNVMGMGEPLTDSQRLNYRCAYLAACTHLDDQIGKILSTLDQLGLRERTRVLYASDHGESMGARGLTGKMTMYDESVSVPMIMAGPEVPIGRVVTTPVSLVDCFPTVLQATGCSMPNERLPGTNLMTIASSDDQDRTVFSEYHAVGFRRAVFMLRDSRYKYIHYVGMQPQLFDLIADPNESNDLARHNDYAETVKDFEQRLRAIVDPEDTDARARADQWLKVEAAGGPSAVIKRGTFANSPTPGEKPKWQRFPVGDRADRIL